MRVRERVHVNMLGVVAYLFCLELAYGVGWWACAAFGCAG